MRFEKGQLVRCIMGKIVRENSLGGAGWQLGYVFKVIGINDMYSEPSIQICFGGIGKNGVYSDWLEPVYDNINIHYLKLCEQPNS